MIGTESASNGPSGEHKIELRRLLLPLLSLAGVGISGYLLYIRLAKTAAYCAGVGDCEKVQSSSYATVGGVPVAFLGLLVYVIILGLGVVQAFGRPNIQWAALVCIFGLALAGVLYSAYLTYVELFLIGAVCVWCVASAGVITAIFGLSLYHICSRGQVQVE